MIGCLLLLAALVPADRVGVVIQYNDSVLETACVEFSGSVTAEEILRRAGPSLEVYQHPTWGAALCGINGVGCPASNCWCDPLNYWAFYYKRNGVWQYSGVGISYPDDGGYVIVQDGGMIGFRWGSFGSNIVDRRFEEVCPPLNSAARRGGQGGDEIQRLAFTLSRNDSCSDVVVTLTSNERIAPFVEVRAVKMGGPFRFECVFKSVTDCNGKAVLSLPPGRYLFQAIAPSYAPLEQEIVIGECGEKEEGGKNVNADKPAVVMEDEEEITGGIVSTAVVMGTGERDGVVLGWEATGWTETGWMDGWRGR